MESRSSGLCFYYVLYITLCKDWTSNYTHPSSIMPHPHVKPYLLTTQSGMYVTPGVLVHLVQLLFSGLELEETPGNGEGSVMTQDILRPQEKLLNTDDKKVQRSIHKILNRTLNF